MEKTAVIQVGFAAARSPSGAFLRSVPIYMPETPELREREKAIISGAEQDLSFYVKAFIEKNADSKQGPSSQPQQVDDGVDDKDLEWWQK